MKTVGLLPLEPYVNSKHPWKSKHLKCGRMVAPTYNSIQRGQKGCAYCAGVAVDPIAARKLFLSKGLKPLVPYPGSNKAPWKSIHMACGKEVSPTYNIIQRGDSMGCQYCSDQFVDPDEAFRFFLSKDLQPLIPYPGTAKPWKSIHTVCGSQIQPRYGHIRAGRVGCPVCAGTVPITQERAKEFFRSRGLEPLEMFQGPHKPWKSKHVECGRIVSPRWASIQQGFGVCKFCSKRVVDIKQVNALLKKLKLKPQEPYPGTGVPWKMVHIPCGNQVTPRYNGLSRGQGPCVHCAGLVVDPVEAKELFASVGLRPLIAYPGAGKPWKSQHLNCGKTVSPTYSYIKAGGKGCLFCAGLAPINELEAIKLLKTRGFKPLAKFPGTKKPWKSKHLVCGKTVSPTFASIKRGGGCKYCQVGGINLQEPGFLYLMTNSSLNSHKVGIGGSNTKIDRISQHKKQGWILYKKMNFKKTEEAYELEQLLLDWVRTDLGLPQYLVSEQMPQGGHTETINATDVDQLFIWAKIEEFSKVKK